MRDDFQGVANRLSDKEISQPSQQGQGLWFKTMEECPPSPQGDPGLIRTTSRDGPPAPWATFMHLALRRCPSHLRLCFPHSSARLQGHPGRGVALMAAGRQGPWQPALWRAQAADFGISHSVCGCAWYRNLGTWLLLPRFGRMGLLRATSMARRQKTSLRPQKSRASWGSHKHGQPPVPAMPWGLPNLLGLEGRASSQRLFLNFKVLD